MHHPLTDNHEDLIRLHKLKDNGTRINFARVEFKPDDSKDLASPEKYKLIIDEERCPDWFNDDRKLKVSETMRGWIKAMIIDGDADILIGGTYILAKGACVSTVKSSRIVVMLGSSQIDEMLGSSQIDKMWGSSNVGVMRESSKVGMMWISSNVGEMRDSSHVGEMRDSSKVGVMWESSKVGMMRGSSKAVDDEREKKPS